MNQQKRKREKGLLAKKRIQASNAFDLGAIYDRFNYCKTGT